MIAPGTPPFSLSAAQAARAIRDGLLSAQDLVGSCLERIGEVDALQARAHQILRRQQAVVDRACRLNGRQRERWRAGRDHLSS